MTIETGEEIKISASEILAGQDIEIKGKNVRIESSENTYTAKEKHEIKQSGLSVTLGSNGITAIQEVAAPIESG